jgi:ElaB/YqjD/DUF883 family membrane-anchored ribosome-binding protein
MKKTEEKTMTVKARNHHRSQYKISNDVEKLKAALFNTTQGLTGRAGEILSESVDNFKEQSSAMRENAADYIANKPFKSVGLTLLAGITIGYLLRRK